MKDNDPLIYSCSGCSSAAQLANHLAIRMDRSEVAEMSCIAGLGGDVASLVRTAKSGRPIVMLDGCPLQCGRHTLLRHDLKPDLHWDLSKKGVRKEKHEDFDPRDAARLEPELAREIETCFPRDERADEGTGSWDNEQPNASMTVKETALYV